MSKAFANDDSGEEEIELPHAPVLPPGTRNYITPEGFSKLESERKELLSEKTSLGSETVEDKSRLRRIEQRLTFLTERLNAAQVIDPATQPAGQILFGAEVTVKNTEGAE